MKASKVMNLLAVVALVLATAIACGPRATPTPAPPADTPVPEIKRITVATDATWPPAEFIDEETKEIVGFDIDLMNAIAEEAGIEVEFKNVTWDGIFAGLEAGEYDAIISSVTVTDERKDKYDFSDPYFNAGQLVVVRVETTDIASHEDFSGKTAGAQIATTGAFAIEEVEGATLKEYDTVDLAYMDLVEGRIDAVVADSPLAYGFVAKYPDKLKTVGVPFTEEWYGIVIQKGNKQLQDLINKGLAAVEGKGLVEALTDKWYGPPEVAIPAPDPEAKSLIRWVEKVDDLAVKLYLNRVDVAFLPKVAFTAFGIQSPANLENFGGGGDLFKNPVGTGPYKFVEWVPDQTITLERFDDFWGDSAKTKTLVYRVIAEPPARALELQAGTVDGIDNVAPDDIPTLEGDANITVYPRPKFNVGYIAFMVDHPPFDNVKVRQAIAHAINKQAIVEALYPPTAEVATQFIPPGIFGHTKGLVDWSYDPGLARVLLAEAGFPDGFETDLWVMPVSRGYFPTPDKVGEAIQADLAAVGIKAEIVTYDWGTYLEKVLDVGEHDICMLGWMADYADATNFLDVFFTGADVHFGSPFPEVVELLAKGGSTIDEAERQAIYDQANELILELVPGVPIVHNSSAIAFLKDWTGVKPDPFSNEFHALVEAPGKDTMIFARNGDSVGLDCIDETDGESFWICEQCMQSLVEFEPGTTNVVPALAERWEVSEDGLEWIFHLRKGVKFHDGTDLNADAVVTNWMRWWDPEDPLHVGHTGEFFYLTYFFGGFKGE